MKQLTKRFVDATLIRLIAYISQRVTLRIAGSPPGVFSETNRRAVANSTDYADSHMSHALGFSDRRHLFDHAFAARNASGLVVEFGVFRGGSISYFASLTNERIYGFDSFEGLREDWKGSNLPKGMFGLGGVPPPVPSNVTLIKGWFDKTLPSFLNEHPEPFSFVHVDCDTYEATSIVLNMAGDRFRKDTVVVFDEYFGYRGWRMGEYKAWQEFIAARGFHYEYLAFDDQAVTLVVTG